MVATAEVALVRLAVLAVRDLLARTVREAALAL
jgi:hypothetical protein